MGVFKNFIFVVIFVGILTRIAFYCYSKKTSKEYVVYLTFLSVGIILLPVVSMTIGFDVAISQYLFALIVWLIFDLMRININLKKIK